MHDATGRVQTVLGPIAPDELGHTQTHEHLLSDLSPLIDLDVPAGERNLLDQEIRLDNYFAIRRDGRNRASARLTDEAEAVAEMRQYVAAGGGSIVESTPIGLGRDPQGLARISRETGVHVIMGAGYYVARVHPSDLADLSVDEIAERIERDVLRGVGAQAIRPGLIGEIGLSWPVHPVEEKVLRASARAQVSTGLPLQIHPGRHTCAPLDALRLVSDAGGDLSRVIMSHVDRTLFNLEDMLSLAVTGCYLEFDLFGQESSYYHRGDIDMPNDATRINYIMDLSARGFERKIVISQDICYKTHFRKYGGEGYTHILENVLPMMLRKTMSNRDVSRICVDNPRDILTIAGGSSFG